MNLWVRLPDPLDAQELLPLAQREGVSYQPGRHFLVGGRRDPGALRLSFTGMPPAQVRQGLTILGRVARGEWARRKADRESAIALV
jgi:2-aminoadipate transaminase